MLMNTHVHVKPDLAYLYQEYRLRVLILLALGSRLRLPRNLHDVVGKISEEPSGSTNRVSLVWLTKYSVIHGANLLTHKNWHLVLSTTLCQRAVYLQISLVCASALHVSQAQR